MTPSVGNSDQTPQWLNADMIENENCHEGLVLRREEAQVFLCGNLCGTGNWGGSRECRRRMAWGDLVWLRERRKHKTLELGKVEDRTNQRKCLDNSRHRLLILTTFRILQHESFAFQDIEPFWVVTTANRTWPICVTFINRVVLCR